MVDEFREAGATEHTQFIWSKDETIAAVKAEQLVFKPGKRRIRQNQQYSPNSHKKSTSPKTKHPQAIDGKSN